MCDLNVHIGLSALHSGNRARDKFQPRFRRQQGTHDGVLPKLFAISGVLSHSRKSGYVHLSTGSKQVTGRSFDVSMGIDMTDLALKIFIA